MTKDDDDREEHTSCPKCDVNFPCMNDRPNCQRGFAEPGSYFGEAHDPIGDILRNVTSPESHAAFIPMSANDLSVVTQVPVTTEQMVEMTSADWHPVNDTGPQVTPEMLTAAKESMLDYGWMSPGDKALTIAYRAMRELEFSTTLTLAPDARMVEDWNNALKERDEAYRYLRGIFEHVAPQCTPLPDLIGICTQVDNALAGARIDADAGRMVVASLENRIKESESYTAAMARTYDENSAIRATNERLRDEITALAAEKNHLHDQLAKFTAANVAEPEPVKPNPFRDFPNDSRRMGR